MGKTILCTLVLCACATTPARPAPLYDRLGGKDAIYAVVDGFMARVASDKRINGYFWNADTANLRQMLFEQICEASGGPCKYTGKDMKTAHAGMNIKASDFNAIVEDLIAVLNQLKVGGHEQKELLGALAPMEPDIVGQ